MSLNTLILLPAYNESRGIGKVIAGIREALPDVLIVVVDDGSTDDTAQKAHDAGATVVRLPFNMGYGVALQTGYKYAQARGVEYLVQMDSDGQHDAAGVAVLLERVTSGRCDLCIGSRFLAGNSYRIPLVRRLGMMLFRRVASMVLHQTITDPTSGFQAMNRPVIAFYCRDSYPVDYPDTNVLLASKRKGFRLGEAAVLMYASEGGNTIHKGLRPLYYIFKMSLDIPLNLLRKE